MYTKTKYVQIIKYAFFFFVLQTAPELLFFISYLSFI